MARVSGKNRFDLAFQAAAIPQAPGFLSTWVPLRLDAAGDTPFLAFSAQCADALAAAFVAAVEGKVKAGRVYENGGPETATQLELMQRVLAETHRRNPLLPVPAAIGKLLALPFAFLPWADIA